METPRGIHDILPDETPKWQGLEALIREFAARYGYREIRTPPLEHTEVFQRTAGETSDIVEKEMYTFQDRSGRSLTLRPEGTAGVVYPVNSNRESVQGIHAYPTVTALPHAPDLAVVCTPAHTVPGLVRECGEV